MFWKKPQALLQSPQNGGRTFENYKAERSMKFTILPALALAALSACTETPYVENQQGVGFSDYQSYSAGQLAREADARRIAQANAAAGISQPVVPPSDRVDVSSIVSTQPPVTPTPAPVQPVTTAAATTPAVPVSNGGISDEQDFSAVSGRETIESDAARIAANKANYQQIEPTALPERPGGETSSIVDFALSTTNSVGESQYRRSGIMADSRFQRNCGKFPSQDKAQETFLASGGPKRDPKGLDPDGDGFACYWDPAPFRSAKMGASLAPAVVPGQ
jgi:hypothetical protein